jgi:translation initiation factor IF-3
VRVIGVESEQLGILTIERAILAAEEAGLDLVEVAPDAKPPVCRIMDYGKYKFQQEKKQTEGKKHQTTVTVKEIKVRPKTGEHDIQVKLRHILEFLEKGFKVRVTVMFRGREIVHAELGLRHLDRIIKECGDKAILESPPKLEGRNMSMVLGSKKS